MPKTPESMIRDVDGVGKVLLKRSARAKYLRITVKPFEGVHVTVPNDVSFSNAERFVNNKTNWIRKNLAKVNGQEYKPSGSVTRHIDGIGDVLLKRSARAKRIRITIKPFDGIHVTVPEGIRFSEAERFVDDKRNWIQKHLTEIKKRKKVSLFYDGTKTLQTRFHTLKVKADDVKKIVIEITEKVIIIRYPKKYQVADSIVQDAIKKGMIEGYRMEAKAYFPKRVEYLAGKYGFKYNKVYIKNLKSKWGGCSERNNINLNLHLMSLPDDLMDYVILHELVHTRIKNHSPLFWTFLEDVCKGAKNLDKKLKQERIMNFF